MTVPLRVIKSLAVTDSNLTASDIAETDYATWSVGTTYALGDRVIITTGVHKVYESLQASNLGKAPQTEPNWWVEVSPTNKWKCLDLSSSTSTAITSSGYYEFTPGQATNAVALINITGIETVRIRLTDPSFGVVYDTGVQDISYIVSESTWYAWFFEPRTEQTQLIFSDLPSYPNAVLRIDVTSAATAYIGALIFGTERAIGKWVNLGVRLGIQDYSRKERNQWGDSVLVQRAYAKRLSFSMVLDNSELDNTFNTLADLRATPCLWIGTDLYRSLSVFGFYANFEINISYALYSDCTIDLESLT